jgi:hypothetical protein
MRVKGRAMREVGYRCVPGTGAAETSDDGANLTHLVGGSSNLDLCYPRNHLRHHYGYEEMVGARIASVENVGAAHMRASRARETQEDQDGRKLESPRSTAQPRYDHRDVLALHGFKPRAQRHSDAAENNR